MAWRSGSYQLQSQRMMTIRSPSRSIISSITSPLFFCHPTFLPIFLLHLIISCSHLSFMYHIRLLSVTLIYRRASLICYIFRILSFMYFEFDSTRSDIAIASKKSGTFLYFLISLTTLIYTPIYFHKAQ